MKSISEQGIRDKNLELIEKLESHICSILRYQWTVEPFRSHLIVSWLKFLLFSLPNILRNIRFWGVSYFLSHTYLLEFGHFSNFILSNAQDNMWYQDQIRSFHFQSMYLVYGTKFLALNSFILHGNMFVFLNPERSTCFFITNNLETSYSTRALTGMSVIILLQELRLTLEN